jgi:hypothetical protein
MQSLPRQDECAERGPLLCVAVESVVLLEEPRKASLQPPGGVRHSFDASLGPGCTESYEINRVSCRSIGSVLEERFESRSGPGGSKRLTPVAMTRDPPNLPTRLDEL